MPQDADVLVEPPPGGAISHCKASAIRLPEGASGEEAFSTLFGACLEHLQANGAAARAGQIEGVHQMRVALRRLRSCLKLFRPLIPKEASAAWVAELRWLNSLLGPVRDWDVFIVEGLMPIAARFPKKRGLRALQDKARALRQGHYQTLYYGLDESRYHQLILSLGGWLEGRGWRESLAEAQREALARPVVEFATAVLQRHHRRVVNRGRQFAQLSGEQRHALRIRIKRLRYAVEFFASLYHGTAAYGRAAAGLQDALGVLNDAVVMERLLEEAGLNRTTPTRHLITGWYAGKLDSYERYFAAQAWERFRACKRPWKKPV